MSWYDTFALFYDPSIERLYRPYRPRILAALAPRPGDRVLLPACGTGQDLPGLVEAVGPEGAVVGVDFSEGMLSKARQRVAAGGWSNVSLHRLDLTAVDEAALVELSGGQGFDRLLFSLTLSALPDWERVFERLFAALRPGGRCAIFDVHAYRRVPQSWWVEVMARAELAREMWAPLERLSEGYSFERLEGSPHIHGGTLILAAGDRPG
jgi:ubiquinone/menaquinone biosynthesis C-methylase UbiE